MRVKCGVTSCKNVLEHVITALCNKIFLWISKSVNRHSNNQFISALVWNELCVNCLIQYCKCNPEFTVFIIYVCEVNLGVPQTPFLLKSYLFCSLDLTKDIIRELPQALYRLMVLK